MGCSPPGSSVHGILQVRILEWVAVPSYRESSQLRDQIPISCIPCIGRQVLYYQATREAQHHDGHSSSIAKAGVTSYHKQDDWKQQKSIISWIRSPKSKIKMSAGLVPSGGPEIESVPYLSPSFWWLLQIFGILWLVTGLLQSLLLSSQNLFPYVYPQCLYPVHLLLFLIRTLVTDRI